MDTLNFQLWRVGRNDKKRRYSSVFSLRNYYRLYEGSGCWAIWTFDPSTWSGLLFGININIVTQEQPTTHTHTKKKAKEFFQWKTKFLVHFTCCTSNSELLNLTTHFLVFPLHFQFLNCTQWKLLPCNQDNTRYKLPSTQILFCHNFKLQITKRSITTTKDLLFLNLLIVGLWGTGWNPWDTNCSIHFDFKSTLDMVTLLEVFLKLESYYKVSWLSPCFHTLHLPVAGSQLF